jgi:hypothetical protein
MSADPDRVLLAASVAFAGAAIAGSAVAVRGQLPGQPCGISVPLSIPAGLLAGWGAGVAAPWPMPLAAARSRRTEPSALTGAVCAGMGMGCVLGTAARLVWAPVRRAKVRAQADAGPGSPNALPATWRAQRIRVTAVSG